MLGLPDETLGEVGGLSTAWHHVPAFVSLTRWPHYFNDPASLLSPSMQRIAAVVALKPQAGGLTLAALREWASQQLPPYQLPTQLLLVPQLKRNAMGKVNKKELLREVLSGSIGGGGGDSKDGGCGGGATASAAA